MVCQELKEKSFFMKNGMAPVYGIAATNLSPEIVSDILKKHLNIYYMA